jgi:hypothetical protein
MVHVRVRVHVKVSVMVNVRVRAMVRVRVRLGGWGECAHAGTGDVYGEGGCEGDSTKTHTVTPAVTNTPTEFTAVPIT